MGYHRRGSEAKLEDGRKSYLGRIISTVLRRRGDSKRETTEMVEGSLGRGREIPGLTSKICIALPSWRKRGLGENSGTSSKKEVRKSAGIYDGEKCLLLGVGNQRQRQCKEGGLGKRGRKI